MGLLRETQQEYYNGVEYGGYQFTSLDDVINQFLVVYVGEGKIIPKASRTDVQFHAMRALQELSFDTFKSTKSQEIILPPSLKMILPQDYVNYSRVACVDADGIMKPLYSTKHTSNPFSISQEEDGDYDFSFEQFLTDNSFERNNGLHSNWSKSSPTHKSGGFFNNPNRIFGGGAKTKIDHRVTVLNRMNGDIVYTGVDDVAGKSLQFQHVSQPVMIGGNVQYDTNVQAVWHEVNVVGIDFIDISASARMFNPQTHNSLYGSTGSTVVGTDVPGGQMKIGIQTMKPDTSAKTKGVLSSNLQDPDLAFMEWTSADIAVTHKEFENINVSAYNKVYFVAFSQIPFNSEQRVNWDGTTATAYDPNAYMIDTDNDGIVDSFDNTNHPTPGRVPYQHVFTNIITDVSCVKTGAGTGKLNPRDQATGDSSTWDKYKTHNANANNESYEYDERRDLDFNEGKRYGISPAHAQENGSFYIDTNRGFINFSSNVSGKTVILEYISDSLGTDAEMQVHKFAEEAVYKSIVCDIMSTRANVPEYAIRRYKKDKSSSKRTAKLRLSNIKLEEITQIFRGKSKHIKH